MARIRLAFSPKEYQFAKISVKIQKPALNQALIEATLICVRKIA
jgi:hypothetical protein